jgi:glycerol-3-phosphate O-acyltransferase/dihydroxyacetone phosphate acyltransferase
MAAWRILIGVWTPSRFEMPLPSFIAKSSLFAPDPPAVVGLPPSIPPTKYKRPERLPSRYIVRNVLRVRLEAARELARLLFDLEEKDVEVNASFWLAEENGGRVGDEQEGDGVQDWEKGMKVAWRGGREVVGFLRSRGARLGDRARGVGERVESDWAAGNSGDEATR